jgi:glycosyltransferase involved in cell wall biosynthesis
MAIRACSDPPPSLTGCTERKHLVRVAVNAEQLLYRSPGGIGRYTAQLLSVMPDLFPADSIAPFTARHTRSQIEAAYASAGLTTELAGATTVLSLPRPLLYESWLRLGVPALPDLGSADLVHAPSAAVPPRGKRPLVVTVHDAAPELFPEAFPSRGVRFHRMGLEAAARRADAVIAVSSAAAEEIAARSRVGAERITVVHNGVRPRVVDDETLERVLRREGLWQRRYVLWIGSLEPRKAVGTLTAAMGGLRRRRRDLEVETVLAGYDGWLGEGQVRSEDRAVLGSSLHQLGRVSEEQLWALYRGAEVFVLPSVHEGFGLPLLEAMSQGTAVLASDIPALREVSGGAAVLVPSGDRRAWDEALETLLDDGGWRQRLEQAGIARSRELSVDRMVAGTNAVYRKVWS